MKEAIDKPDNNSALIDYKNTNNKVLLQQIINLYHGVKADSRANLLPHSANPTIHANLIDTTIVLESSNNRISIQNEHDLEHNQTHTYKVLEAYRTLSCPEKKKAENVLRN